MDLKSKIYLAGHRGMVGSAILRILNYRGFHNVITKNHEELDLTNQAQVYEFFAYEKPDFVILAAAKVGGIYANNEFPAEFIYNNMMIEFNVIDSAHKFGVKRLLFLGSTCIYPVGIDQPMAEEAILSNFLEPTNEPYAIAKIAGIKMCESYNRQYSTDFRSVMPTNLYGINDNFHPENSHVIPGLIARMHNSKVNNDKKFKVWGSGNASREFLYVDDMAEACLFVLDLDKSTYDSNTKPRISHINIGTGKDLTIRELSEMIKEVVGFDGEIIFDDSKPDGPMRKLCDVSRLSNLGWNYKVELKEGLEKTYKWFLKQ